MISTLTSCIEIHRLRKTKLDALTQKHTFLWNFYETRRNCFFNACFYHSLWKHTDIFHDTKCMKVHARSSGTKYLYYLTNQLYCHWLFPTIFNIRYCQLSSSRNLSKPIMNLIYFAGKHKDTWISKILVSWFLNRLRLTLICHTHILSNKYCCYRNSLL